MSQIPDGYNNEALHPVGETHPEYPEAYRVTGKQIHNLVGSNYFTCDECPMDGPRCDRSCGFGSAWVSAVTWIRIRMMENTNEH